MRSLRKLSLGVGFCSLLSLASCMQERDPIITVQPGAIPKSFFLGNDLASTSDDPEFYWRNYVVDASASQSLIGVGSYSGVDRIRWEVTEDLLIARKAYQIADGQDGKAAPEAIPDGTVVAAFAITSHFDIRRNYNPATGEEMNVIEENTRDLPWYSRQFVRVDWSQNLVDSPLWDDVFMGKVFGNLTISPMKYDVTDPNDPNAPQVDAKQGYLDITTKYYVKPAESSLIPGLPTCVVVGLYTGSTTYECDDQEATVRSSFLRVDPNRQFEPLEITKAPLDIVGNPAGIRSGSLIIGLTGGIEQGWDPGYGYNDAMYKRFAHIHNVWEASHQDAACEVDDDLDLDGTADACANVVTGYSGSAGSRCDMASLKCTIPLRDRTIRTVGYWVNREFPTELQDSVDDAGDRVKEGAAEEMIAAWNQLMSGAVARAREVECRRTGGDRDACAAEFLEPEKEMIAYGGWLVDKAKDTTPVLTLCHNPVRKYDRTDVCGDVGAAARLGDIRKNFFAYWPHASRAPWGGIGNWGGDPKTGEIHGAAAMIMGRSATYAAALQRDVIQVALGDLSIEDITNGVPAENYAHQLQHGRAPETFTAEQLDGRVRSIDATHALSTIGPATVAGATVAEKAAAFFEMHEESSLAAESLRASQLEIDALAGALRGTTLEAQLVDDHWLVGAAGLSPTSDVNGSVLDAVSPLRGLDPGLMRAVKHDVHTALEARGACFHDTEASVFGSVDLQGLARYFAEKYPDSDFTPEQRGERIYQDLWVEAFKGIAIHELGHSLGLLHNFASSWDSPNFHPGYWQLRTHEGTSTDSCKGVPRDGDVSDVAGDTCMGPRYLDPATDDEQGLAEESRPGIDYYGQTSVMEYSIERFGETIGLGQYDAHAMKALYGRVLETFEDEDRGGLDANAQESMAPRLQSQLIESDRVVRADAPFVGQKFAKPTHYTELARRMKIFDPARCRDATEEEKARAGWRLVHGKICAPAPRDHAAWADFEDGPTDEGDPSSLAPAVRTRATALSGGGKLRWFYRYGTSNNGYFHTNPGDAGADPYEVARNTIQKFDAMYPWTYFRRGDREYLADVVPFGVANNTLERLRSYHWSAANRNAFFKTFGQGTFEQIAGSDDWHKPAILAETEAFRAMARILLMPEPGEYAESADMVGNERAIWDVAPNGSFAIGAVDGRFIEEDYDSDPSGGGSWDYHHWMNHAGFGVEKTFAAMALADARPVLSTISRENYLDGRDSMINFRSDMPDAVDRLFGGILAEDWESVGMFVEPGEPTPTPQLLDLADPDGAERPSSARILFPNVGYKQQLGVLVFANIYSRAGADMQLVNKMRLWLLGHDDAIEVAENLQVRFTDPVSGYVYVAKRYGSDAIDGKPVDKGIASRMIARANDLLTATYEVQLDGDGEVLRDAFGAPVLATDADGLPMLREGALETRLTRYVGLLDAARQIGAKLGAGPLSGE
jgi:hypothetical protein